MGTGAELLETIWFCITNLLKVFLNRKKNPLKWLGSQWMGSASTLYISIRTHGYSIILYYLGFEGPGPQFFMIFWRRTISLFLKPVFQFRNWEVVFKYRIIVFYFLFFITKIIFSQQNIISIHCTSADTKHS